MVQITNIATNFIMQKCLSYGLYEKLCMVY